MYTILSFILLNLRYMLSLIMFILYRIPEDINDDNYRNLPRGSNCAQFYAPSCPYRVLDFLTFNATGPKTK